MDLIYFKYLVQFIIYYSDLIHNRVFIAKLETVYEILRHFNNSFEYFFKLRIIRIEMMSFIHLQKRVIRSNKSFTLKHKKMNEGSMQ